MKRWVITIGITGVISFPVAAAVGLVLMLLMLAMGFAGNAAAEGSSTPKPSGCSTSVDGGDLMVESSEGIRVTLGKQQLENAASLVEGVIAAGGNERVQQIVLMAGLQESKLNRLASSHVPDSLEHANDGIGEDDESVGVLQGQTKYGWGTTEELLDPFYNGLMFAGGPEGPNQGNPPGLFDLEGWESLSMGESAQQVLRSGHPEAYDQWEAPAKEVLRHLQGHASTDCAVSSGDAAYPLPAYAPFSDDIGPRSCSVPNSDGSCAHSLWHVGVDIVGECGTPVYATRPGTVVLLSGYWLTIQTPDGTDVSYLHMYESEVLVSVGQQVQAGQQIGVIGNEGPSSGCHLDLRINALNSTDPAVQALPHIGDASVPAGHVDPTAYLALYGVSLKQ